MILAILLALLVIYVLHLVLKYVIKPYLRMREFAGIEGVYILKFIPLIGAFHLASQSFNTTGDQNHFAKLAYHTYPGMRALITNGLDKVFIILTDPQLLRLYFQNDSKLYVKERYFIENRIRVFGDGVAFAEGRQWAKRRRIMSSVFHYEFYESFVDKIVTIVETQCQQFDQQLTHNKKNHQPTPVQINSMQFASMIAGKTVVKSFFGVKFDDCLQDVQLSVYLQRLVAKVGSQERTLRSFMFGVGLLKMGLFEQDREVNRQIKVFRAMVNDSITRKLSENQHQQGTLLQILQQKNLINTPQGLTTNQLIQQFLTLFIAGTDTTSHLMGMLLYYIAINSHVQQKLRKQLIKLQRSEINYKTINGLEYLSNVIKETFRHYDYMVSTFPRVALEEHVLGDMRIKKGDMIMPGWAQLNYHPSVFPQPNDFNPDRWSSADTHPQIDMIFSPFSNGPRSCLGKNFALLQTKIVTYMMLTKYKITLKQGYVHLLKARALYEPVNPIILLLQPIQSVA